MPKLFSGLDYTLYAWAKSPLRLKNFWKEKIVNDDKKSLINKEIICGYKLVKFRKYNNKISELIFASKDQKIIVVKAKFFILAMGGIENGRFIQKSLRKKI